jgi:sensor histidine kinase YesM
MKLRLPKYSSKDYTVLPLVVLPYTLALNAGVFGARYFSGVAYFLTATAVTGISFSLYFILCGGVAVLMKKRFPHDSQVPRRLAIMIISFLIMSGLFLVLLFNLLSAIKYFDYKFDEERFVWGYIGLGIINIFLTFLHEGIARYEKWKEKQKETEELKTVYRRSRLAGLKSQVNPHFLFNSLNSLSSLISEDEEQAEKFLDEMSKVYRYMLRTDDDNLVTLDTELKFLDSYAYLLKTRYGSGLQLQAVIDDDDRKKFLPALTLQAIVENAFTQNSVQKNRPLVIQIRSDKKNLIITNNIQPKNMEEDFDTEAGLDNLVGKYRLLSQKEVKIADADQYRTITLPLLDQKSELVL